MPENHMYKDAKIVESGKNVWLESPAFPLQIEHFEVHNNSRHVVRVNLRFDNNKLVIMVNGD